MARMIIRSQPRDRDGTKMGLAEIIVSLCIVAALAWGVRYYFVVYRTSPGFVLGEYLGAVKAGNVPRQYELIDSADKKMLPTEADYEKNVQQARGYTARITNVQLSAPKPDAKNPDVATVEAAVSMRAPSQGQALYQTGETKDYKNTFTLRKDSNGRWKVWLTKSMPQMEMLTAKPNAPGESF
jgi:hypothetical protein